MTVVWHDVKNHPPVEDDEGSYTRSEPVLMTDGRKIHVGFLEMSETFGEVWKLSFRHSYNFAATHWAFLPPKPPKETK